MHVECGLWMEKNEAGSHLLVNYIRDKTLIEQ